MKIRTLMMAGMICNIFVLVAIMALFLFAADRNFNTMGRIVGQEVPGLVGAIDALAQGARCGIATRNVVINPADQKTRENFKDAAKQMDGAFDEAIAASGADPALKDELVRLKKLGDDYLATAWNIQEAAAAGNQGQAEAMLKEQEVPLWRDFRTKTLDLTRKNKQDFKQSAADVVATMKTSKNLILALGVFGIALLIGTSGYVFRQVLGQLGGEPAEVARIAKEVADGNLALELKQGQGGIYGAMSVMAADLRRIIEMVNAGSRQVSAAAAELDASARQSASLTQQALQQSHSVRWPARRCRQRAPTLPATATARRRIPGAPAGPPRMGRRSSAPPRPTWRTSPATSAAQPPSSNSWAPAPIR